MTDDRATTETQVDRHVRRGELFEACVLLRELAADFPDDASLLARLQSLEQNLEPSERQRVAMAAREPSVAQSNPVSRAEAHAAEGRFEVALSEYRALLAQRPDWELVRERIAELEPLASSTGAKRQPVNREAVLEHLLDRITTRRRT